MKDAIYARVSSKEQDEAQQIPSIKVTFNLPGDIMTYREEVSAWNIDKSEKRDEFNRLIKDIKGGVITNLYIWSIDRLYRNRKKTKEFFEMCAYYKVNVFSVNQKWLNDFQNLKLSFPENFKFLIDNIYNLLLDVYAQTAQDESDRKSKNVKLKVTKDEKGVTCSTNGRKWGRKTLNERVIQEVLNHKGKPMRWIAENVFYYDKHNNKKNLSLGAVHKILSEKNGKK
jgi:DNA invertase Pin-like site-specific DNA recombinase